MPETHFASSHRPEQYRASRLISTFTALAVAIFLIGPMSARAQSAAGAGVSSSVTPKYCADHPTDSAKCLPPGDGIPPLPKPQPPPPASVGPVVVPTPAPVADPQQAIDQFNAQAARNEAAIKAATAPVPATSAQAWQNIQRQVNEQNEQNAIQEQQIEQQNEAMREQQKQYQAQEQRNFQSGQQMGAGGARLAILLAQRHKMKSFCKKNPGGVWRRGDGATFACSR